MKKKNQNFEPKPLSFPTSVKEMHHCGWEQADVILFSGDAFVDHPAFGTAIIARVLEREGFKVAIVPQPNWRDDLRDFKKLGVPKYFFGATAGNMDSMVNHYTANKRLRSNDAYTPDSLAGQRPDYAVSVYSKIIKSIYPTVPLLLGGVEASLRRFTHYDYWSDSLKPSVLIDSDADLLLYGMAEKSLVQVARRLRNGEPVSALTDITQTAYRTSAMPEKHENSIWLASYDECTKDPKLFARNFILEEEESNKIIQKTLVEPYDQQWVVVNPAYPPISDQEMDEIYDLPFTRKPHPRYEGKGKIAAFEMIKDSVTIHRGCFGGCSFCTISAHQGKFISSRSKNSILQELQSIAKDPEFKGHISDLGGPSANMYQMKGIDEHICELCRRPSCIYPSVCKNLSTEYSPLLSLYSDSRKVKGIKKITIGSGIRYDLIFDPKNRPLSSGAFQYFKELVQYHVSGRLKVAPEHTSQKVLKSMRKPSFEQFIHLKERFDSLCSELDLHQQLIPYFISSLPESGLDEMADVSMQLRDLGIRLEQVQDFTPTPFTLGSVVYYTGLDPYSMKKVEVAKSLKEKKVQQLFFFLYKEEKREELRRELKNRKRYDLIKKLAL